MMATLAYAQAQAPRALGLPAPHWQPASAAQIELGRKLFMDRRLSPNNTMSCAMCHIPEQAFAANELATAVGINGRSVKRNAPSLLNVVFNQSLFWDGRESSLERQAWLPLLHPNEMGNASVASVLDKIAALPGYAGLFLAAFNRAAPTRDNVAAALAAYQRSLIAADTRFDRWLFGGDAAALNALEQRGFQAFQQFGCSQCHLVGAREALFTDHRFHNTGIGYAQAARNRSYRVPLAPGVEITVDDAALASVSEPQQSDDGRMEANGDASQRYAYRTPSLRSVALTAPYMHDGSLATLGEVIDFYRRGGGADPAKSPMLQAQPIGAEDQRALIAFLRALNSDQVQRLARAARAR